MRTILCAATALALLTTTGCSSRDNRSAKMAIADASHQIAWREGDVEDAFREAKEAGKPVMLYWGAKWCPPCNAMKAGLFKDPAFIAETEKFIPVHLDGDAKNAQIWGERLKIDGYPTVIIMRPDRTEVTRLSRTDAAGRLTAVLHASASRTTSIRDLLRKAQQSPSSLSAADWSVLAGNDLTYVPEPLSADVLERIAAQAPSPSAGFRLRLAALDNRLNAKPDAPFTATQQQQAAALVAAALAQPGTTPLDLTILSTALPKLPKGTQRAALADQIAAAARRMIDDTSGPLVDRAYALSVIVTVANDKNGGKPLAALGPETEKVTTTLDRSAKDPMLRQALVPVLAETLATAGNIPAAERMVNAELPHAYAPSYYMGIMSWLTWTKGDKPASVAWARRSYEAAEGPATRVKLAVDYGEAVLESTSKDRAAVQRSTDAILAAVAANTGGFRDRTRQGVKNWKVDLNKWSKTHDGAAIVQRARAGATSACARESDQAACRAMLTA